MENWETIITFTLPHTAHLAKSKLESEGIKVFIFNDIITQVHNFRSNAFGGVQLKVSREDYDQAIEILKECGYIKESTPQSKFIVLLDQFTSKIPLLGKQVFEFRIIVLITILIMLVALPFLL